MRAIPRKLLSVSNCPRQQPISSAFRLISTPLLVRNPCLQARPNRIHFFQVLRQFACFTMTTATAEQPWHAAYPEAQSKPASISRSEVLDLLQNGKDDEKFVLVDLRRTDYEVCRLTVSRGL
jgi:hypothetical protein